MALWMQITPGTDKAVYVQIMDQVSEAVARGELKPGDRLPAVRKLAAELVVNPNTVARAYTLLEQSGLVNTKTGSGTFVSDPRLRRRDAADLNLLTERMDTVIARALTLGLEPEALVSLFSERMQRFVPNSSKRERKR
ncbi:MAG: GntR family transcriptional regulator [Planctomycetes bacterium]|nr:GntR family transcriptional regulator [Planctomycetota bacterium]